MRSPRCRWRWCRSDGGDCSRPPLERWLSPLADHGLGFDLNAPARIEQAERRIPTTFGRARIFVVIDLADSQAGCQELAVGRTTLENLLRAMPEASTTRTTGASSHFAISAVEPSSLVGDAPPRRPRAS